MKINNFILILFFLFTLNLHADIVNDYLNKNYSKICNYDNIKKYKNKEKELSIIGASCIKIDALYLLPSIINNLKKTKNGRKNSIYFSTVFIEKKLLYSFIFDNISLESFSFPMTDYILSKIFYAIKTHNYRKFGQKYIIKINNITYHFYKDKDKMFIDTFENGKLKKRRWFR